MCVSSIFRNLQGCKVYKLTLKCNEYSFVLFFAVSPSFWRRSSNQINFVPMQVRSNPHRFLEPGGRNLKLQNKSELSDIYGGRKSQRNIEKVINSLAPRTPLRSRPVPGCPWSSGRPRECAQIRPGAKHLLLKTMPRTDIFSER